MNQRRALNEPRRIAWNDELSERRIIRHFSGALSDIASHNSRNHESGDESRYYYSDDLDEKEFGGLLPFLYRIFRLFIIVSFWTITGACSYALFYKWMMPRIVASKSFSFDYGFPNQHDTSPTGDQVSNLYHDFHGESLSSCSTLTCTPLAKVDLFARHNGWEALHESIIPRPITERRILQPHKEYYIDVILELPESKLNIEAGVFGLVVELASSTNQTRLAKAQISGSFPFESAWVSLARKVCLLPAFLLGAMHESRMVYHTPFRHFLESLDFPIQYATIMLTTKSREHFVEVLRGVILIGEEMNMVQEVMKEYYYTCFLLGTVVFMGINYMAWKSSLALNEFVIDRVFNMQEPPCDLDLDGDMDEFFDTDTLGENFDDFQDLNEENVATGERVRAFGGDAYTSPSNLSSNEVPSEDTPEGFSSNYADNQSPRPSSLPTSQEQQIGSLSDIDGSEGEWEDL